MVQKSAKQSVKVLHVAFTLHDPIISKWLIRLLEKTKSKNVHIDLMTTADEAPVFQETIKSIGGKILVCPHPKNKGEFLRYLRESIEKQSDDLNHSPAYDVIHIHPFIMAGYILIQAFRSGIPVRVTHSHTDRRKMRRERSFIEKLRYKLSKTLIQRLSTHGVSPSSYIAEDVFGKKWKQDERWQLMPYGQEITSYDTQNEEERRKKIKENLGISLKSQVISQITPFYFEKNHDLTLNIFEKEAKKNLSLVLVLVGDGPLKEKIKKLILLKGLEGRVIFLGPSTDHSDILSITNLLIMPSLYETDISVVVEARLQGVRCLISDEIECENYLKYHGLHTLGVECGLDIWTNAVRNILRADLNQGHNEIESLRGSPYDIDINSGKFLGLYHQSQQLKN